jgi:hypothetical protein
MTTYGRKRRYWESSTSDDSSSSFEDRHHDFILLAAAAAAAAAAVVVTNTCRKSSRTPSRSPSYDRDRSNWKVPKIIECKSNVIDNVEAADLPEKAPDMEKIGPLSTTTSLSSLSCNARATNHKANEPSSSDDLAKALRDLNSSIMQAKMVRQEMRRKDKEFRRQVRLQEEEYRREDERFDELVRLCERQEALYVERRNPALDEEQKRKLEADIDDVKKRKTALAIELRMTDKLSDNSDAK